MILEIDGKRPVRGTHVFVAPNAIVAGDVVIGDNTSIWYGAVIRGDGDRIVIGKNSNIQDNCTVHSDRGMPVVIGDNVTVGHNSVVHACTIEDDCLIGMHAVVMNGACIDKGTIVAAGSVVTKGKAVGPFQLAAGIPAAVQKELAPAVALKITGDAAADYLALSKKHQQFKILKD